MVKVVFACGLLLASAATSAQTREAERLDQTGARLEAYRNQLETMEVQLGRYDPQLLETLEQLAEANMELNRFERTDEILDRSIQILRISDGLYTESQFPFLILSIRNNVRQGNWRDANETLDHLTWLYTMVPRDWNDALVRELKQLADLHLEGVAGDATLMKDPHFRAADRVSRVAMLGAELIWSASDPRLIDLYYYLLLQNHIKFMALIQGGPVAADLRQVAAGVGWMRRRQDVKHMYFYLGMEMLNRMRRGYLMADTPNPEALAMVDVHEADWLVLFNEGDPAAAYRQAYASLRMAGVPEETLGAFFSVPRILPVRQFYPSVAQAMKAFASEADDADCRTACQATLRFTEWSSTTPNVQMPLERSLLLAQQYTAMNTATVQINLKSVETVSQWIRGRLVSQKSVTDGFEWLASTGRASLDADALEDRLHYLNFRPVLDAGVPQDFSGRLEYRYFPPDRD